MEKELMQKHGAVWRWLEALGHPEKGRFIVHVVGTNGKGSTGRVIAAALEKITGEKVGHFSSPHVVCYRERICIGQEPISERKLECVREEMQAAADRIALPELTFFQRSLVEAMLAFRSLGILVMEAGIGGRLDATHLIETDVVVITTIATDHQKELGMSLTEIAAQKAGVIGEGEPVISSDQKKDVKEALIDVAESRHTRIHFLKKSMVELEDIQTEAPQPRMYFRYRGLWLSGDYETPLIGIHQLQNLGTALYALETMLREKSVVRNLKMRDSALSEEDLRQRIRDAITGTPMTGRMQRISTHPEIWADGAHNDQAVTVLMENLKLLGMTGKKRPVLIFGMHEGKIQEGVRARLFAMASKVYPISLQDTDQKIQQNVRDAIMSAQKELPLQPILVTGSLYLPAGAY